MYDGSCKDLLLCEQVFNTKNQVSNIDAGQQKNSHTNFFIAFCKKKSFQEILGKSKLIIFAMRDPIPRTGNYQLDRLKKMSMTDTKPNFHLRNGKKEIIAKSSLKVNTVFIVSVPYFRHIQTSFKT